MSWEERLVYREIMDEIWISGCVVDDPVILSKLLHIPQEAMQRTWPAIRACLVPMSADPQFLTSERLDEERAKRDVIRRKRKKAGKLGGEASQAKKRESAKTPASLGDNTQANARKVLKQNSTIAQPIQDLEQDHIPPLAPQGAGPASSSSSYSPDFEIFWTAYPRKEAKGAAWKAWKQLRPDRTLQGQILEAVARFRTSEKWAEENGRFIPHPSTWINKRRWEDSPPPQSGRYRPKGVAL